MRVRAGTDCTVRVDAVTYWIAAQLKTPAKIDQSMASVPLLIEREGAFSSFVSASSHPPFFLTTFNFIDLYADKRQLSAQIYMCG